MHNVDLNATYVADVEPMLLEHYTGYGSEYESFD